MNMEMGLVRTGRTYSPCKRYHKKMDFIGLMYKTRDVKILVLVQNS